jgi:hypothetical protein
VVLWWEKCPKIAHDLIISAEAGIHAFQQLVDFKAKDAGPRLSRLCRKRENGGKSSAKWE